MAQARPSNHRTGRRIVVQAPVPARAAVVNRRTAPLPPRPASRVTWSVFAIEPDGRTSKVITGLTAEVALRRAAQWWAAEQDRGGDRDFAAGLSRPSTELAEQECREMSRCVSEGKPKPWDYE